MFGKFAVNKSSPWAVIQNSTINLQVYQYRSLESERISIELSKAAMCEGIPHRGNPTVNIHCTY